MIVKKIYALKGRISSKTNYQYCSQIHFIGIAGCGMSGIAKILVNFGYKVTGSDLLVNKVVTELVRLGVRFFLNHDAKNVYGANLVVVSSAIKDDNPEIIAAKEEKILIIHRSEMLSELMKLKFGVAVSGTHGKSTTTAMIVNIFYESRYDPAFVNGGIIKSLGTCAHFGDGRHFIVEADESDASFLNLYPEILVITSISSDHMDTYQGSFEILRKTFLKFLHNLPVSGKAVLCYDDLMVRSLLPEVNRNVITYGFSTDADLHIVQYSQKIDKNSFILCRKNMADLPIVMSVPGRHNALNAAAAIAVAKECGVNDNSILRAMFQFSGVQRRFDYLGTYNIKCFNGTCREVILMHDYGHHPVELDVTIETIRIGWPKKRLVMVFQPHRFTRTRDLYDDFVRVLSKVDVLLMFEVYSAGERFIPGSDSFSLCATIRRYGKINPILVSEKVFFYVLSLILGDNDFLLMQGAGTVVNMAYKLAENRLILPC